MFTFRDVLLFSGAWTNLKPKLKEMGRHLTLEVSEQDIDGKVKRTANFSDVTHMEEFVKENKLNLFTKVSGVLK